MIVLRNLCKTYSLLGQHITVADSINAVFPSRVSVALLGRNGAGKTTLLRMIAGTSDPSSGEILSTGSISFPVGFAGSFHADMTGAQNTRFVARIYGVDTDAMMAYVEDFAELGEQFHLPVRSYSSGMRSRLSFGVSMALNFDTYLIDEITAVGDAGFKKKSRAVFKDRMRNAGAIFVSHSIGNVRDMCQAGAVLEAGKLTYYDDIEEAIERHNFNMDGVQSSMAAAIGTDPDSGEPMAFPADARMFFGFGAPHAGCDWLSDYLRRSRACHFSATRELHYFDILAGQAQDILQRRQKLPRTLVARLLPGTTAQNQNTLRLIRETAELLAIHATPPNSGPNSGPDASPDAAPDAGQTGTSSHKAYLDYLLKDRRTQPLVCDFTPGYACLDAASYAEMARIGAARFAFVLRDPVDRLWAQICAGPAAGSAEACSQVARRMIDAGGLAARPEIDYARTITALEASVPANRIKYLFYERLFEQPVLDDLCGFLGIPARAADSPPVLPPAPALPPALAAELRQLLAGQYDALRRHFGAALPAGWR